MAKIGNLQGLSALAKVAKEKRGKEVLTVQLEDVISKEQVRKKFNNIEELAETMKVEGQQSPIIVFPKNEKGKYVIQKGERRWRSLKVAGIKTIDIIVNEKKLSKLEETAGELIENIQREGLAPLEIAEALKKFADNGWKQKAIAQRIGKSAIYVSTHLSLLKLPDAVQELYDRDICSDTETLNNLRLLFDLCEERCRAVCALAIDDGITRKQSRDLLNDAKQIKENSNNSKAVSYSQDTEVLDSIESGLKTTLETLETDNRHQPSVNNKPKSKRQAEKFDWKNAEPDDVVIAVNISKKDVPTRGTLILNRVSKDPREVWVRIVEGKQEKEISVLASELELVSIEA